MTLVVVGTAVQVHVHCRAEDKPSNELLPAGNCIRAAIFMPLGVEALGLNACRPNVRNLLEV